MSLVAIGQEHMRLTEAVILVSDECPSPASATHLYTFSPYSTDSKKRSRLLQTGIFPSASVQGVEGGADMTAETHTHTGTAFSGERK